MAQKGIRVPRALGDWFIERAGKVYIGEGYIGLGVLSLIPLSPTRDILVGEEGEVDKALAGVGWEPVQKDIRYR